MNKITVALCKGKRVRDPKTNWLLEVGKPYQVEKTQFWLRRLECKDVEEFKEPKGEPKPEPEQKSEPVTSSKKVSKKGGKKLGDSD